MLFKIIPYLLYLAFIGAILYLDRTNQGFRQKVLGVKTHDHYGQWRADNHDSVVDDTNLFETFSYFRPEPQFSSKKQQEKFQKLGYTTFRVATHQDETIRQHHPEYADRSVYPETKPVVIFVIQGNQGSGTAESPILINSIEKQFNYLTELQKTQTLPPEFGHYGQKTHFHFEVFGFDFHDQPQVFSDAMFKDQAEYIQLVIKQQLTIFPKDQNYTIIGHSLGCLTAKFIDLDSRLQNIVCLGGTLDESPMKLNGDIQNIIDESKAKADSGALNILFQSGSKDILIPYQNYQEGPNTLIIDTDRDLKNLYSSLNHPSQLYSTYFINVLAPLFPKIILGANPMESAKNHLLLNYNEVIQPKFSDSEALSDEIQTCVDSQSIDISFVNTVQISDLIKNTKNEDQYLKIQFGKNKKLQYQLLFEKLPKDIEMDLCYFSKEKWMKIENFKQHKYHNYFPNEFLSFKTKNMEQLCFRFFAGINWKHHKADLKKDWEAWNKYIGQKNMNFNQTLQKTNETSLLRISADYSNSAETFRNDNLFEYAILTKFRRDIWQILFFVIILVCILAIYDFVQSPLRSQNTKSVSQLQRSIIIFHIASLVKNRYLQNLMILAEKQWIQASKLDENLDFMALTWNAICSDPFWLILKMTIVFSLAQVSRLLIFEVPQNQNEEEDSSNQKEFTSQDSEYYVNNCILCLYFMPILINLQLGIQGGLWNVDQTVENTWFGGEPFILLDLVSIIILVLKSVIIRRKGKDKNAGFKYLLRLFLFVHISLNIDRIFTDLWKLQNFESVMYQTKRSSIWDKGSLVFLEQNVISTTLLFLGYYH